MRVGLGFDAHKFTEGRPLVLGGVLVNYPLGLEGHSDADVLVHALMDALLGAAGAGDIGRHFPDSDPRLEDVSSIKLLKQVVKMLLDRGYKAYQVDTVIIAEKPRLAPYLEEMRAQLAAVLHLTSDMVNIKATTTEHMGFTGRGEGIAAQAVALLASKEQDRT